MEKIDYAKATEIALNLGLSDPHDAMKAYNQAVNDANVIIHELNEKLDGWEQQIKNQGLVPPL